MTTMKRILTAAGITTALLLSGSIVHAEISCHQRMIVEALDNSAEMMGISTQVTIKV
jgi:hypothetical protein